VTTALNEVAEPLEVALDAAVNESQGAPDVFEEPFRFVFEPQGNARTVVTFRCEHHRTRVVCSRYALPCDSLIGSLLGDLGFPFNVLSANIRVPEKSCVVLLPDRLHP